MADPYKPNSGFAPSGSGGPLPATQVIQELIDGSREGNRTILPPAQRNPGGALQTPFPVLASPTPAIPKDSQRPNYVPSAVIPQFREQATVAALPEVPGEPPVPKPDFFSGLFVNQVATGGGKATIVLPSALAAKAFPRVITPLPAGVGGLTGFALGLPGGTIGAAIATSPEAGVGEEADLSRAAAARQLAREAAAQSVQALSGAEMQAVRDALQSSVVAGAFISEFNATSTTNARTLAAGLAVDAARGAVGLDLVSVAGGAAVARRESFVAGLLGLMLPNDSVGGVGLFNPSPQRGDP